MNKILYLFDENYVKNLFREKVLPLYPDFYDIKKIEIDAPKKYIWEKTYHVVIKFKTSFITKENKTKKLTIYCSAHSNEPRKNVYDALKYLWEHNFSKGWLSIPHPLFYSEYFQGTFYRGVNGRNLYQFIREKNYSEIEKIIPKAAAWFAKLHRLPTKDAPNFNPENSRIKTVVPGVNHILQKIKERYPQYFNIYKELYNIFMNKEERFLNRNKQRWFVHGDAHPENIIKMSERKLAVIDFTDISLSDFARDLGSFLQQLEYMSNRKIADPIYTKKIKDLFLESYLKEAKMSLSTDLEERIMNYYYWTAIRTATFFLLKHNHEPERAKPLINQVSQEVLNYNI